MMENTMKILAIVFAFIGALCAIVATYRAIKSLRYRLYIEKKLAYNLAVSLKKRKIESSVSVNLNKITIKGRYNKKQADLFKKEIDGALKEAIKELVVSERKLVIRSIDQPSKKGQFNYLKRLVENSLEQLQEKQA